jgi:hypothetical protein
LSGADTSYTATRLSGSVAALNNFFSQPGAAWYDSNFAATLKMRVVGSVASAGAIAITTKPAAEAPVAGPTLAIPASFAVPTLGGDIRFAPNAIGGSGSLTVTVSASTGTLSVFNDDAVEVGGTPNLDGVLIGGTALARTFTGTATALNAYLSAAGKLRYSGAATALSISVASDSAQGKIVTAAGESTLSGLSAQSLAPALALNAPAQLAVAQGTNTTALIFAQGAVSASASSDPITLTLTAPAGGTLHWAADSALKASSTASTTLAASTAGANSLTLFGTAEQINAYLTSPAGSIRYSGASGTLAIEAVQGTGALRATSQIAIAAVPMQVSPGLTLPQSLNVVAGESTPLLASVDPVAFAGSGNLSVTVSVASGSLAADLAGLASPPTITPVTTSGRTTSLTITGSPSVIDTLFADGRVRLVATAADTVQVSVQSVSISALRADGSFAITVAPASGSRVTPTIAVAERIALASAGNTPIQFVNAPFAAGASSTPVVLTLAASAGGGVLEARRSDGSIISSDSTTVSGLVLPGETAGAGSGSVTLEGSNTGTLTVSGTVAAVNAWVGEAGLLSYRASSGGTAPAPAGRLGLTLALASPAPAGVSASASVLLQTPSQAITPSIVALPASMPITAGSTSDLRFTGVDLSDNTTADDPVLTLTLALPGEPGLDLEDAEGLALVNVAGNALSNERLTELQATVTPRMITVTGTASALETLLAGTAERITYAGPALATGSTPLVLKASLANSAGSSSVNVVLGAARGCGDTWRARADRVCGRCVCQPRDCWR